jgi:hypothetical protein
MNLDVALIREQGVQFAVVVVKRSALNDRRAHATITNTVVPHLGSVPVVLMAQDSAGTPTYVGRRDLVDFLAQCDVEDLPWRSLSLAA